MQRERVTDDIYVFTSDLYAQVTASVILTSRGAVLFDTLMHPEETQRIKWYIQERLGANVTYVINSHFHADHTTGTCFFEGVEVVAHTRCRELLDQRGRESLERAKASSPEMRDLTLVLPTLVFQDSLTLHMGNKTLELWSSPGHSPDSLVCYIREDQILFGADTVMSIPYFADGSYDDLLNSLEKLQAWPFEHIVQGHGEVILRGEVEEKFSSDILYLKKLREAVDLALSSRAPETALNAIDIETCGKSRILLNGAAQQLHRHNVLLLAEQRGSLRKG